MLKAKIIELCLEFITMKDNKTTKALLIEAAQEAWDLLEDQMLDELFGMQNRVDAAGEWCTKY